MRFLIGGGHGQNGRNGLVGRRGRWGRWGSVAGVGTGVVGVGACTCHSRGLLPASRGRAPACRCGGTWRVVAGEDQTHRTA
jgi:hypothetical protein